MADFTGKVAIVTGAGDGIGRSTARLPKRRHGHAARRQRRDQVASDIAAAASRSRRWTFATPPPGKPCRRFLRRLGTIDILVNNAGIAVPGDTAADISEETWDRSWMLTPRAFGSA